MISLYVKRYENENSYSNRSLEVFSKLEKEYFLPKKIYHKPEMLYEILKTFCEVNSIKIDI